MNYGFSMDRQFKQVNDYKIGWKHRIISVENTRYAIFSKAVCTILSIVSIL